MSQSLFNQPLNVINVGIAMFSDDLKKQHTAVTQLDWTPPGQGNMQVVAALDTTLGADEQPYYTFFDAANKLDWQRRVEAITYVMQHDHAQYAGGLGADEQARIIASAIGGRGPNRDYLYNTAAHLAELGLPDPEMEALAAEVRKLST